MERVRPWPYSLPKWLRPRKGTTYAQVHGDGGEGQGSVGVLQKVLYGVPDPQ
ncbi:hypothetical protein C7974DRAFT_399445 [Boeremia exigua]|uniref:uncharacterized protein n=1 Tax=Boeremia exigua TaxID=749465 RepID=UPI001E8D6930|nr:uncharacterized protein C7974DRAFT_399445 [Boeremia exigua]KAH6620316.1 hypothetical protein C7974DRAFT_399445 [Boeremia exigua]